jgi:hypothetical protein
VKSRELVLTAAAISWLTLIGIGTHSIWTYSSTPSAPANAQNKWPRTSQIKQDPDLYSLVLFVHPKCPCTRATLEELSILMTQLKGKLISHAIFVKPQSTGADWEKDFLWFKTQQIPGVTVHVDLEGAEAQLFGAKTSGQALLYSKQGDLLSSGGITESRGHAGDNVGVDAILAQVSNPNETIRTAPVFGCSLLKSRGQLNAKKLDN